MQIQLGEMTVEVEQKDIKNLHLSVYPPTGRVRISAPLRMDLDTIRVFAITKLGWIKNQQKKLREQERETPREYLDRESHYLWGKRYLLAVTEGNQPPQVQLQHRKILLQVRPGTDAEKKQEVIEAWYREQIRQAIPSLLTKWEPVIGVQVGKVFVQRMKTRWGSCNAATGSIRLNSELAKKPRECLEYLVVHELVHLMEPTHNNHFIALMDQFMPNWQMYREILNRIPVAHECWKY
jgi:hypothetical protein